jgi:hypothetical protein
MRRYWDGDCRAQVVWHVTCTELQLSRHAVLAVELVVALGRVVVGTPGTRQVVWQVAACELHSIMQAVTFPDCASLILSPAIAPDAVADIAIAARKNAKLRITPPIRPDERPSS